MTFIYVASPYSHVDPKVRDQRYRRVAYYISSLLIQRRWCYSPIVHCHEVALTYKFPTSFEYWAEYNFAMLSAAEAMHVLTIEGWEQSIGVAAESAFWKQTRQGGPQIQYVGYKT
jgi:Domain of unknown function (DUF1937)